MVMNLLIINTLMLLFTWLMQSSFHVDLDQLLGLHSPQSEYFRPYQYVSMMFMHAGFEHLFFNMFALFMFGITLEQYWGSKRFLLFYLFTGLGAAGLHTLVTEVEIWHMQRAASAVLENFSSQSFLSFVQDYGSNRLYQSVLSGLSTIKGAMSFQLVREASDIMHGIIEQQMNVPTVGASGAIYGVLLGFGMIFPNAELFIMFIPIPIKAKYAVMGFAAIELFMGISAPGSSIAHFAHLGGMLFGLILILYWKRHGSKFA